MGDSTRQSSTRTASSRREFLCQGSASAVAGLAFAGLPFAIPASRTTPIGNRTAFRSGEFEFEFDHQWAQLPDRYHWQTTHNVAVDSAGFVYVIHEGKRDLPDHPAIFVFDPEGTFVRAFGAEFQGGGHGLEIRREGSDEYLYVSAYLGLNCIAKLTLTGEPIWKQFAPMDAGVYADDEVESAQKKGPSVWGRDRFMPTNFAFLPDGDILVADGYGSWFIHRYDSDGQWKSCFGGPGDGEGTFNTPHGIQVDTRSETPTILVCDRAHHQLQTFDLDGEYMATQSGFGLPANADFHNGLLLVPELLGRISLVDESGTIVAVLGDDRQRVEADSGHAIRRTPDQWHDGRFVHPHDACFDADGNIFVAEWVAGGRLSKLTRR